jgi:hypothetical protein
MAIQRVTFTEWTPDLPGIAENLSIAKNVVPTAIGYAPFPTGVDYSGAASETLNNVFAGRFNTTTSVFAGGTTKLFKFDSDDLTMDNVSKSAARTITNVALTSNVATITTSSNHGYSTDDSVTIDASNNTFDGAYVITSTPTPTTFTYDKTYSTAKTITNVSLTSNVATITSAAHGYSVSDYVTVNCSNDIFDGNYTITAVTTNTFSYALTNPDVTSVAATGTIYKGIESASASGTAIANGYTGVSRWNFIQFGNTIVAANDKNKLQAWTLGSSTYFGDVSPAAPIAKYITVVRDFVVAANLDSGTASNKVIWSDINDETDWTSGGASQSDFQIIADGGNITGITGGEFGLVLLERAIVRMSYIGSPFFFQFDTIARGLGCIEGNSVTKYGNTTYFLGDDGFYSCDGSTVTAIGTQKVDKWFYENANPSLLNEMSASADPVNKIIVWNFINIFGGNSFLIYNWQVQKWSYGNTDVDYISSIAQPGITLEGLDSLYNITAGSFVNGKQYTITSLGTTNFTLIGAVENKVGVRFTATGVGSGTGTAVDLAAAQSSERTLDSLKTSLDSRLWSGGKFLFAGVRNDRIITFTGANSVAEIQTGDIGSEATSVVTLARPIIDNGSADVAIASRIRLNEVPEFGAYVPASNENRVSLRSSGKYHRLSIVPTGDQWTNALAVDIEITQQGTR